MDAAQGYLAQFLRRKGFEFGAQAAEPLSK